MNLKQKTYNHFVQLINSKIHALEKVLADLKESGANETKSTAGDKHETALAMLQIEQANTRAQLQELLMQQAALKKIDPGICSDVVVKGSLIKTGKNCFYVSTALGKAIIDGQPVFALSPQSPLGKLLIGLKAGDSVSLNNAVYQIDKIE